MDTPDARLLDYLSDLYSIEQQALAQLRTAPDLAGEPTLAAAFRDHLAETERQAERVRERLEAHGGSPGRVKDAVMRLGGKGFLLFARVQPDTPGKLCAHAHSYEAFEWAGYEMLLRAAERAGDETTAGAARAIRDEERAMQERIAATFEAVADASLGEKEGDEIDRALVHYLADAHALEAQAIQLLDKGSEIGGSPELRRLYAGHLVESREHARRVDERLEALGGDHSTVKDTALRAAALNWGLLLPGPLRHPGQARRFRLRLRAPGDRRLRAPAPGGRAGRRPADDRPLRPHPRRGARDGRAPRRRLRRRLRGVPRRGGGRRESVRRAGWAGLPAPRPRAVGWPAAVALLRERHLDDAGEGDLGGVTVGRDTDRDLGLQDVAP